MTLVRIVFVASCLLSTGAVYSQDSRPAKIDARAEFQPCTTCHGRPDPELSSDQLWIDRVSETTCVQPLGKKSAPLRGALRAYLLGKDDVPKRESTVRDAAAGEGQIALSEPENLSVLLTPIASDGKSATPIRLVWKAEDGKAARTLPAGRYRVQHYAITRRDTQGTEWQLWGSGAKGRTIVVAAAEEPTRLNFNPGVRLASTAMWTDVGLQVGLAPTGDGGMGVTIMRAGKRIKTKYRLLGTEGVTAKGPMSYG